MAMTIDAWLAANTALLQGLGLGWKQTVISFDSLLKEKMLLLIQFHKALSPKHFTKLCSRCKKCYFLQGIPGMPACTPLWTLCTTGTTSSVGLVYCTKKPGQSSCCWYLLFLANPLTETVIIFQTALPGFGTTCSATNPILPAALPEARKGVFFRRGSNHRLSSVRVGW